ncbi:lysine transporter LysE [Elstera litoralis]|uniref:Lysine transporter LysE n=1 Tax=Elstera litoralis TaxID=552518 RepID=A0A0F3IV12_9PROT|nr:LysE family translocator [Elstera litoralis]KJV10472.1 lysine transporter LysE [Elstera litoralis]
MTLALLLSYTLIAATAILSPGPAILLAIRNSLAHGIGAVLWSSLGNITGLFCLSTASMLGLGVMLQTSALLFGVVKLIGALYLFWIGLRHLFGRASLAALPETTLPHRNPGALALYREGAALAITNPKPILFFAALFPQFLVSDAPILPQFFTLTGIFMGISFASLFGYALLARQARGVLLKPMIVRWVNRTVGGIFVSFGVLLLTLRRPAA